VAQDLALGRVDEAHATHVRRQLIDLIEAAPSQRDRRIARAGLPQVEQLEIVGGGRREFRMFEVYPADPISLSFEPGHQVTRDETARSAHQCLLHNDAPSRSCAEVYHRPVGHAALPRRVTVRYLPLPTC